MEKVYKLTTLRRTNILHWFDRPGHGASVDGNGIQVAGWALSDQNLQVFVRNDQDLSLMEMKIDVRRPDVVRAIMQDPNISFNSANDVCGFNLTLPEDWISVSLGIKVGKDDISWLTKVEVVDPVKTSELAKVIRGRNGWLFLDNDTNQSVKQFTGERVLSDEELSLWVDYLERTHEMMASRQVPVVFAISPSKEYIFPDFHPKERGELTPLEQIMSFDYKKIKFVFPIDELYQAREMTYCKTDTHWNDFGASVATKNILTSLGLTHHVQHIPSTYRVTETSGDLGSKLRSHEKSSSLYFSSISKPYKEVFSNQVFGSGLVKKHENETAPDERKLIIFGSCSSLQLCDIFSRIFKHVTFIHTESSSWDERILDFEKPDIILLHMNQRFIISPPPREFSLAELLRYKAQYIPADERKRLISNAIESNHETTSIYCSNILDYMDF